MWSTYPIATAHLIGLTLKTLTGIPWVTDFRDSMTEDNYPEDARKRSVYRWIEQRTVKRSERIIFTAPSAVDMYKSRYPNFQENKWACLLNGYDEENFSTDITSTNPDPSEEKKLLLLHSGILYPSERDPSEFFLALGKLKKDGHISEKNIEVRLRASVYHELLQKMVDAAGVSDIVSFVPGISYREALNEMERADGLLIFQASNCNHQIPAKLYEYIRAQRPILALTDSTGDTAGVMNDCGLTNITPLDSRRDIAVDLLRFIDQIRSGSSPILEKHVIERYSRRSQTESLAHILDNL